jgi:hypothetical protein
VNLTQAENRQVAGVGEQQDADRMLVMNSLHSTELSSPLHKVIAKSYCTTVPDLRTSFTE